MAHPVVHFEIAGKDGPRLTSFYRDLFGWDIQDAGPDYWLVKGEEEGIGGGLFKTRDGMPPYVTVYVATPDLNASLERAVELGGKRLVEPTEIPATGTFAMVQDPDGNVIGLFTEL